MKIFKLTPNLLTFLIFILTISSAFTQTTHNVEVKSNSFTPQDLEISVGDSVVWTNIGGSHNVNGTQATFASNPESFGNEVGEGWIYSFKFTIAGSYNYQCNPHASFGMTGTVTVSEVEPTGIPQSFKASEQLEIYPNPAQEIIYIENNEGYVFNRLKVYNAAGKQVIEQEITGQKEIRLDISSISSGLYFVLLTGEQNNRYSRFVKQ